MKNTLHYVVPLLCGVVPLFAQEPVVSPPLAPPALDGREGRNLLLENFRPQPTLKVPEHRLTQARFPLIDIHTHFRIKLKTTEQLDDFVKVMDRNRIAMCVSLDGRIGVHLREHLDFLSKYPNRFVVFANIDWQGKATADDFAAWDCHAPDFVHRTCEQLKEAKRIGAMGIKVFKSLGLEIKNPDGTFTRIDDPRWDPIWRTCGELEFPVLIHTADPVAFFQPIDEKNERWEELHRRPEWSFHGPQFPKYDELLRQFIAVVERHPQTKFIAAHIANSGEDLKQIGGWLDKYPNLYVDIASRINELGRQPYSAREFLIKYQDRVLFGTDGPWPEPRLRLYWRFLETYDENFPYSEKEFPPQGLWNIHGVGLPEEVLKKIYFENAVKILDVKTTYDRAAKQ